VEESRKSDTASEESGMASREVVTGPVEESGGSATLVLVGAVQTTEAPMVVNSSTAVSAAR
jgi:hypothetical protein